MSHADRSNRYGMGRIYLRGKRWWVAYYKNGEEIRESARSEREQVAVRLLKDRLSDGENGVRLGTSTRKLTVNDLADGLVQLYKLRGNRSLKSLQSSLRHVRRLLGHCRVNQLIADHIERYAMERQGEGAAAASIRNELAFLHHMCKVGADKGMLKTIPHMPRIAVDNVREGFLEPEQFQQLVTQFDNQDLRDAVEFLYLLGWRVGEMRTLRWSHIQDREIRLAPQHDKIKKGRTVPVDALCQLRSLIDRRRRRRRLDCPFVFHRNGRPVGEFKKSWLTACRRAGLVGLVPHDLRRSAIRNMIRAGMPESVAMKFSGHKTRAMLDRYNITSTEDMQRYGREYGEHISQCTHKAPTVVPLAKRRQ